MDKNAIKKYAVWARRELIERVTQKAQQFGIEKGKDLNPEADSINGKLLTENEKKQRQALVTKIQNEGFEQVMEEVAYIWFNRFIALRFMEVNGYLPSHIRVFTDESNSFRPQILTEALHLDFDGLNKELVFSMKEDNQDEELFKYLLIVQCNALNSILPVMFQKISDYTELLLPDYLLREGSVIEQMISSIPEEDWTDQVQIIGWLYQYYNTEPKAAVFGRNTQNKIKKEEIPAATQLFTPDWIVRYLVENSLGKKWIGCNPNSLLRDKWEYCFENLEGALEEGVEPKDIKLLDPCMGSGHILCYAFDVFMQIYDEYGYTPHEAVLSILENNLYGLDIDYRATQLAYFAVMMKARQYDRRLFSTEVQPHVCCVVSSNHIDKEILNYFINDNNKIRTAITAVISGLYDADEYGSLIKIEEIDYECLNRRLVEVNDESTIYSYYVENQIKPLIQLARNITNKYDICVTNPPYMGNASAKLTEYLQQNYPDEKYDTYAAFIRRGIEYVKKGGYISLVTGESWMFLPSFINLRKKLLSNTVLSTMAHFGFGAFDNGFGTTAFVLRKTTDVDKEGIYIRCVDDKTEDDKREHLLKAVSNDTERYVRNQDIFSKIEGCPIVYWMNLTVLDAFENSSLSNHATTKAGIVTGNNDYFMKLWHEIDFSEIVFDSKTGITSFPKWVPAHKGAGNLRYYGNLYYVMRLEDLWNPNLAKSNMRRGDTDYYFKEGLTWSTLSNRLAFRYSPEGFVYETKGSMCFANSNTNLYYMMGLLNSSLCQYIMDILSPTLDYNRSSLLKMPYLESDVEDEIVEDVKKCVALAKEDWDSYETSWDFKKHPLL